jgi:thymidylate synthase
MSPFWRFQRAAMSPKAAGMTAHPEQQYLDLVRRCWAEGDERRDRTGVGTRALFGELMRFSLADDVVPLLTTKRVAWKAAVRELIWFLSGDTNIRPLVAQGVHIWTDWPLDRYRRETGEAIDRDAFERRIVEDDVFAARWGDLGPVYGAQWTRWRRFEPAGDGLFREGEPVNQIAGLIAALRSNPSSRRLLFTGWNVAELPGMALPPCHMTYQFFVAGGRLSCALYQRSCDIGLGLPFNLFEAAVLTRMVAQQCDLDAGELVWFGADVHLYLNHDALVEGLLARAPRPLPRLLLLRRPPTIFDYGFEDFAINGYDPHPHIAAPVAV